MKVIFLDFDGVLNSNIFVLDPKQKAPFFLEDDKMLLLKNIIEKTNAKIVLSTSWREVWNTELSVSKQLKDYFDSFDIEVYDVTKCVNYHRPSEIKEWLSRHDVSHYVILDDIINPWDGLDAHVITTNLDGQGLTEELSLQAIQLLNDSI